MKQITLTMEESLYNFYKKVGQQAGGLSPEKVMSDALFKLAGELALNALHKNQKGQCTFWQAQKTPSAAGEGSFLCVC